VSLEHLRQGWQRQTLVDFGGTVSYDAANLLTSLTAPDSSTSFAYDDDNRVQTGDPAAPAGIDRHGLV
jgi:hypothetical protein